MQKLKKILNKYSIKNTLAIVFIVFINLNTYSQLFKKMTIIRNDNSQLEISGIFEYENNLITNIRFENSNQNSSLQNISKVIINEKQYLVKEYNSKKLLFLQILKGKISLYKDKKEYYIENNKYGLKKIKEKELVNIPVFKLGEISIFINNCKLAINELDKKATNLTLKNLKNIINIYNTCDLSTELQISDSAINQSMLPEEKVKFGISVGISTLDTDYNKLLAIKTSKLNVVSFGAKIYFLPNMLDKKINFNISVDYFLENTQNASNPDYNLYSKIQFLKTMVGVNYMFNNINQTFKPYIGISGGMYFNSNTTVQLVSKSVDPSIKYRANNNLAYNLNIGTIINILNQEVDFIIEYQPSLDFTLFSKSNITTNYNSFEIEGLNFKISYMF